MVRNGCGARVGLPSAARTASTAQHEHPQRKPGVGPSAAQERAEADDESVERCAGPPEQRQRVRHYQGGTRITTCRAAPGRDP
jgi:hypothetical protein